MNNILDPVMKAHAELSRIFSEIPEVTDLLVQLNEGLITPIEYSYKIRNEWNGFISRVVSS